MDGNNCTGGGGAPRSGTPGVPCGPTGAINSNVVTVGPVVNNTTTISGGGKNVRN